MVPESRSRLARFAALARAQGAGAAAAPPDTWRELAAAAAARGSSCAALEALGAVAPRLGAEDRLAAAARCAAVGAAAAGAGAARVARAAFDALLEASDGDAAYLEACGGWRALAAALAGAPAEAAAAAADVAAAAAAREGLADASPLARLAPLLVERAARAAAEGDGDAAWSLCWALGEVGAALPPEALGHLRGAADALVAGLALPFVQRKWEMTYHLGPSLPTIPMGGDEATWSALALLAESSKAPNVANAGLAAGVAAVRPRAELVVLIALASTARGFPRHAIAETLA